MPTNILFSGFQNLYLIKQEFDHFNGMRITMRPPMHPCKVGIHLRVSIGNEHEHFVGHIMDTNNPNPGEFQSYELPISLFHQDFVLSKILNPMVDDLFHTNGITFSVESDKETQGDPIVLDV